VVHFPSLLCKLGIYKFLIEDSSASDKVVQALCLSDAALKIFLDLFLIGGELLFNIVLASAYSSMKQP